MLKLRPGHGPVPLSAPGPGSCCCAPARPRGCGRSMDGEAARAAEEPEPEPEPGRSKTFIRLNDLSGHGGRPAPGDKDAGSGGSEADALPYPALAPVVFFYLSQHSRPRSWCLRMVCNPYPLPAGRWHHAGGPPPRLRSCFGMDGSWKLSRCAKPVGGGDGTLGLGLLLSMSGLRVGAEGGKGPGAACPPGGRSAGAAGCWAGRRLRAPAQSLQWFPPGWEARLDLSPVPFHLSVSNSHLGSFSRTSFRAFSMFPAQAGRDFSGLEVIT